MAYMKSVDITTIIGCPLLCSYCPQDKFIKNYKSNIRILTLEKLKLILKNVDKTQYMLNISGYSESMSNFEIAEMLLYCYNEGYVINLFTTLQGFNNKILEKLSGNISFNYVCFHESDGTSFNKEQFKINTLKFISNINIQRTKVGIGNSSFNYEIKTIDEPFSRANNIQNVKKIPKVEHKTGKIVCNFYGQNLIYSTNQILPNGDVYMCCMDWSLQHKIGNIFEHKLDSDEFNIERKKISNLLLEEDNNVLCRNCEFSAYL